MLAHGHEIGVGQHGGYAEVARVPADWVVPLPDGLSARDAMALGTAGFTAALSVVRLEENGLSPDDAAARCSCSARRAASARSPSRSSPARGYEVHAATGKADEADFLRSLGASEVLSREETSAESDRPMEQAALGRGRRPGRRRRDRRTRCARRATAGRSR